MADDTTPASGPEKIAPSKFRYLNQASRNAAEAKCVEYYRNGVSYRDILALMLADGVIMNTSHVQNFVSKSGVPMRGPGNRGGNPRAQLTTEQKEAITRRRLQLVEEKILEKHRQDRAVARTEDLNDPQVQPRPARWVNTPPTDAPSAKDRPMLMHHFRNARDIMRRLGVQKAVVDIDDGVNMDMGWDD